MRTRGKEESNSWEPLCTTPYFRCCRSRKRSGKLICILRFSLRYSPASPNRRDSSSPKWRTRKVSANSWREKDSSGLYLMKTTPERKSTLLSIIAYRVFLFLFCFGIELSQATFLRRQSSRIWTSRIQMVCLSPHMMERCTDTGTATTMASTKRHSQTLSSHSHARLVICAHSQQKRSLSRKKSAGKLLRKMKRPERPIPCGNILQTRYKSSCGHLRISACRR